MKTCALEQLGLLSYIERAQSQQTDLEPPSPTSIIRRMCMCAQGDDSSQKYMFINLFLKQNLHSSQGPGKITHCGGGTARALAKSFAALLAPPPPPPPQTLRTTAGAGAASAAGPSAGVVLPTATSACKFVCTINTERTRIDG